MRVSVLPTGRTEWHGLGMALSRLFPGHEFYCLPSKAEIQSYNETYPYNGFTSTPLALGGEQSPPKSALHLVRRAADEALGDRDRRAADLVLIVDDLELCNAHQPGVVTAVMRGAVEAHLKEVSQRSNSLFGDKTRKALREKVSFHLIAPMIEAWFFADQKALALAGVAADMPVFFDDSTDPEAFVTADPAFLKADEADCPALALLTPQKKKDKRPAWLGALPRCRHPKGYLQWLCRSPKVPSRTNYTESQSGVRALARICWQDLFGRDPNHFAFLRAMVEDMAEGLECSPATGAIGGKPSPFSDRTRAGQNAVLRNI